MSRPNSTADKTEKFVAGVLAKAGWSVARRPATEGADLLIKRGDLSYEVEIKTAPEGRRDRLIALWSQVHLKAATAAGTSRRSLAIVVAPRISERVAEQVLSFAATHAPDAAAGVVDLEGLRRFRGKGLEALNSNHDDEPRRGPAAKKPPRDFFSDMNQWMLKVLIAPELPETLLSAPRGRYQNASELASAAGVSVMTAFRFVDHLRREGHIHESRRHLELVRRDALFKRWLAATMLRPVKELPMRFLLGPGDMNRELRRMSRDRRACVGLFAAARALGFGFVEGVPPHVYVRQLDPASIASFDNVTRTDEGDSVQLMVRQASTPESLFRGAVCADDMTVSDVFQTWLDVAGHPSRGAEQADLIRRRALSHVLTVDE